MTLGAQLQLYSGLPRPRGQGAAQARKFDYSLPAISPPFGRLAYCFSHGRTWRADTDADECSIQVMTESYCCRGFSTRMTRITRRL